MSSIQHLLYHPSYAHIFPPALRPPPSPMKVLEGQEGAQAVGWPAFHKSMVHASPLLYDLDFDGVRDILVSTYDGEILGFRDTVGGWVGPGGGMTASASNECCVPKPRTRSRLEVINLSQTLNLTLSIRGRG